MFCGKSIKNHFINFQIEPGKVSLVMSPEVEVSSMFKNFEIVIFIAKSLLEFHHFS